MLQNDYNHENVSRNFKRLIFEKGHNNSSLAKEAGVDEGTIRNLVKEDTPFNPKIETLIAVSNVLGVSVDDIILPKDY